MRIISNIFWILFGGIWLALAWAILGIFWCITIIGIPFGVQCFKAAGLAFAPHGKKVRLHYARHPIANLIWLILFGWELALAHLLLGVLHCITIIGIPRGIQCLKIMKLSLIPFGADVERR